MVNHRKASMSSSFESSSSHSSSSSTSIPAFDHASTLTSDRMILGVPAPLVQRMLLLQVVLELIGVAMSVLTAHLIVVTVFNVVLLVMMSLAWPLRGSRLDRIVVLLVGLTSTVFAYTAGSDGGIHLSIRWKPDWNSGYPIELVPYVRWCSAYVTLIVFACILGFARHMFRLHRSELVSRLSHLMLACVAAASAAGWLFLPRAVRVVQHVARLVKPVSPLVFWGIVAVCVGALLLTVCINLVSVRWLIDSSAYTAEQPFAQNPSWKFASWVGMSIIPVMFVGLLMFTIGFVVVAIAPHSIILV